jgi:hypothetical protein
MVATVMSEGSIQFSVEALRERGLFEYVFFLEDKQ